MPKLSTISSLSPQHVLLFGPPKSGKTQLISKLAEHYDLIWFDLEHGMDTLRKLPIEWQEKITLVGIRDTIDTPRAHGTIDKILKGGAFRICDDHGTVDCALCKKNQIADRWTEVEIPQRTDEESLKRIIVLDSLSQLTISVNATVTINRDETYKEQFDDWAAQGKYLNRMMSYIQNAPYHIACTAHELMAEREDGNKRIVPSIGTTNYAVNSAKFFGHVVYMDKVNMRHRAYSSTDYSNSVITGSRLDIAVEDMAEPDLLAIFQGKIPTEPRRKQQAAAVLSSVSNNSNNSNNSGAINTGAIKLPGLGGLKIGTT